MIMEHVKVELSLIHNQPSKVGLTSRPGRDGLKAALTTSREKDGGPARSSHFVKTFVGGCELPGRELLTTANRNPLCARQAALDPTPAPHPLKILKRKPKTPARLKTLFIIPTDRPRPRLADIGNAAHMAVSEL
jgi:hypothetical protein